MKKFITTLFFTLFANNFVSAQSIQIVVPNPPGGVVDQFGRALARTINETNPGASAIVVNKPGADGKIAVRYFLENSLKQDMIFVAATGPILFNKVFNKKLDYDFTDFEFLIPFGITPVGLAVPKRNGISSVEDLVKYAEKKPLNCAGSSTAMIFAGRMFLHHLNLTNAEFIHFKGTGDMIPAFMSGVIDCMFDAVTTIPQNDRTEMLAISSNTRLPEYPNVKLFSDSVPNFNFNLFYGFAINSKLNSNDKDRLLNLMIKATNSPQWVQSYPKGVTPSKPLKDPQQWLVQQYNSYERMRKILNIDQSN